MAAGLDSPARTTSWGSSEPSGKQQLQTSYSQRLGHHADLGGEINRDEIPVMYQQYIREYMSEVRQQAIREQAKRHKQ